VVKDAMPKTNKKYTFAQLEELIQQAKRVKNQVKLVKYKSLVKLKQKHWANSLLTGQQKLFERQQYKKSAKQAQINKKLAKQIHKDRLAEIYSYFRRELNQSNRKQSPYFTAHLDLEPTLAKALAKQQKQVPEYDFYAEFKRHKKHLVYKLNKSGSAHLLSQTAKAYQEELADHKSQIRYYQKEAGLTRINPQHLIKKGQKIKLFFPKKGEHKEFIKKKKEFEKVWREIKTSASDDTITLEQSKRLYESSPRRIRDRNLQVAQKKGDKYYFVSGDDMIIPRDQSIFKPKDEEWSTSGVFKKYYKENPFEPTKKHYRQAITEMLRKPLFTGEPVPEEEIELNEDNWPRLKEGQVISVDTTNAKPGRSWSIRKNVPSLEKVIKEKVHEVAHQGYLEEYGTSLEIQTWQQKKEPALCWVEAMGLGDCSANVGTSNWWCLECIRYGPYHPPVLPKHCSWEYTYRRDICSGSQKHSDANKQWHFSIQGERTRDAIKGSDWGSCHIGTFGQIKQEKSQRRKNWILKG
jgi:hypothetical protein